MRLRPASPGPAARRALAALALTALGAAPLGAQPRYTGPDPALAPGEDRRAVGSTVPSTVYWDQAGQPYVLRGPDERQYLGDYNVTWTDRNHVLTPPGVGGFDCRPDRGHRGRAPPEARIGRGSLRRGRRTRRPPFPDPQARAEAEPPRVHRSIPTRSASAPTRHRRVDRWGPRA